MRRIITISREFGSGGRTIGKLVADKLGINYYDKELIEKIAEETGFSKKFIEQNGEYARGKNLFSYAFLGRTTQGKSVEDCIWETQRNIILNLAEKESCVIVGRCADYILSDRDDCLNVFIHADKEFKKDRIVKLYGETADKPEKRLKDKDKRRSVNYKFYTDRQWGKASNYHICLDSSEIGIDRCVEIICTLI